MASRLDELIKLAETQYGYFTAAQADGYGIGDNLRVYHCKVGHWKKVGRGLYRLLDCDDTLEAEFTRWSLWSRNKQNQPQAIISHQSALFFHKLTTEKPEQVHLSVPAEFRKAVPKECKLYKETVNLSEIEPHETFMVTTVDKTLRDMKIDPGSLRQWAFQDQKPDVNDKPHVGNFASALIDKNVVKTVPAGVGAAGMTDASGEPTVDAGAGQFAQRTWMMINRQTRQSNAFRAGFTLVELLVVIAIIGILAAMLLPALTKAQQSARAGYCLGNFKQINLGLMMYAEEHDGNLMGSNVVDPSGTMQAWTYALNDQLELGFTFSRHQTRNFGILQCPENKVQFCPTMLGTGEEETSYSANGWRTVPGMPFGTKITGWSYPSSLFLIREGTYYAYPYPQKDDGEGSAPDVGIGAAYTRYPHPVCNILYGDGHSSPLMLLRGRGTIVDSSKAETSPDRYENGKFWYAKK